MNNKWTLALVFSAVNIFSVAINLVNAAPERDITKYMQKTNPSFNFKPLSLGNTIGDIATHPAFDHYGERLLPNDNNRSIYAIPISRVASILPYHSHVQPEIVLQSVNQLIAEVNDGKTVFYDIYNQQEKQRDPEKINTGLFFYRGQEGAPFAVVSPGGGFAYVGSLHEGLPIAHEISQKGLNAFVIRYRIGSERKATEDLAKAIEFIINNADELGVSSKNYSLWGGSAGARMVGDIALNSLPYYGVNNLVQPATVVIAYTGQYSYSSQFPATFMIVSENDRIASATVMVRRASLLRQSGVEVEFHQYKTASHGFGTGEGTDAQGWIDDAVRFWQKQINK